MTRIVDGMRGLLGRGRLRLDRFAIRVKSRFDLFRPLRLFVFRGHGLPDRLRISGRLIEESGVEKPSKEHGLIRNALTTIRRMESDEIPDARIRVSAGGASGETTTDREGFFSIELECEPDVSPGWHQVAAEVLASPANEPGVSGKGEVLVPAPDCEFGVISDLDDTVIDTGARNKTTQVRQLLARDAQTHPAFPGIGEFYRLLQRGPDGRGENPIFYVSKSAWNLYDLFEEFLETNDIPRGPMFLQDAAVIEPKSRAVGSESHKVETIGDILSLHASMDFVLIGDSGQHDAETFLAVVERWPDRIRAVYLRDVTPPSRDHEVAGILRRIEEMGVPTLAAPETVELSRHAERIGLIQQGSSGRAAVDGSP